METPDLTSPAYWESDSIDLRLNPRRTIDAEGLKSFLEKEAGVRSAVVMATSGSSGEFKFVVLSKSALLASARAVVEHSGLERNDVALAALSDFHVGGLGIHARAFLSGGRVVVPGSNRWERDGSAWLPTIEREGVSLLSMTPTHLHDLVAHGVVCPRSVRIVFLGGARMDRGLIDRARELGWPIRASYGMTEASSQIATARGKEVGSLPILPSWETRIDGDGRLAIRGDALFSGYASKRDGKWQFNAVRDDDGWFATGDRCELVDGKLRFLGRADDLVKISGEFVSVSAVDALAASIGLELGTAAAVVAVPDGRRGNLLVLFAEAGESDAREFLDRMNRELDGIESVREIRLVENLPRTEIGKIDRAALSAIAEG